MVWFAGIELRKVLPADSPELIGRDMFDFKPSRGFRDERILEFDRQSEARPKCRMPSGDTGAGFELFRVTSHRITSTSADRDGTCGARRSTNAD